MRYKKVKDNRLSYNRILSSKIPYISKDEKILLDNNKPSPNCISIYGGLVR
jgi:hypothetical protein